LLAGQSLAEGGGQPPGEDAGGAFLLEDLFPFHIDYLHGRKGPIGDALRHAQGKKSAPSGVEIGLYRRRRRAEEHRRPRHAPSDHGHVPGGVRQAFVLFIGGVVFFIHNDQFQIPDGGEKGGAGAHDDAQLSRLEKPPLVIADGAGYAAVEDGDVLPAESLGQTGEQLRGEGDFRNEENRPPALSLRLLHGPEIDLRFAASRDPVEEKGSEFSRLEIPEDFLEGRFLPGIGHGHRGNRTHRRPGRQAPEQLPLGDRHEALPGQRRQERTDVAQTPAQFGHGHPLSLPDEP